MGNYLTEPFNQQGFWPRSNEKCESTSTKEWLDDPECRPVVPGPNLTHPLLWFLESSCSFLSWYKLWDLISCSLFPEYLPRVKESITTLVFFLRLSLHQPWSNMKWLHGVANVCPPASPMGAPIFSWLVDSKSKVNHCHCSCISLLLPPALLEEEMEGWRRGGGELPWLHSSNSYLPGACKACASWVSVA